MSLAGLQPSNVSSRRRDTPSVDAQWSPECYASRSAFSSSLPQCNCLGMQQDGESAMQPSHRTLHIPSFHFSPSLHSERYAAMLETRPIIKVIVGNFLGAAIDAQILKIVVEEVSPVSTSSSSAPHLLERKSCPAHGGSQLRTWDRSLGSQRCSSTWTEITKAPGTHLNPERRIFGQRSGERKRVTSLLLPPSLLHSVTSQ